MSSKVLRLQNEYVKHRNQPHYHNLYLIVLQTLHIYHRAIKANFLKRKPGVTGQFEMVSVTKMLHSINLWLMWVTFISIVLIFSLLLNTTLMLFLLLSSGRFPNKRTQLRVKLQYSKTRQFLTNPTFGKLLLRWDLL